MITILIGIVIGIGIAIIRVRQSEYCEDLFDYVFASIFGGVFGGVLGLIVANFIPSKTFIHEQVSEIESLQDNNSTSGRFFLASGNIDGEMKYVMYLRNGKTFSMVQASYKYSEIEYTEGQPVLIEYTKKMQPNEWVNRFSIDFDLGFKGYLIKVPKGTIKNSYNLDAM